MSETESGVRRDAGSVYEARDHRVVRGPSRINPPPSTLERIRTLVVDEHDDIARLVAARIAALIREKEAAGDRAVLGLATGSTPVGVYRELIRMHRTEGLSFQDVVTFNLDEYHPMSPESIHSYHRFMWENLFSHVNIDPDNVHIPRGDADRDTIDLVTLRYEEAIRQAGGIDLQILGIGKTGHIGFNEPGSGADSRTRLVHLDVVTRRDAAADFFGEDNVPREAVTMGVATILEAREIVILATGEHKARIVKRAVEGEIDLEAAATFLQRHPNTTFYVDRPAAAELTRIATPWLLDEVEWTPDLVTRAVVWLAGRTDKAILKLTPRDYAENQLSSLVARFGAAGDVNGTVFNVLGSKIRGKSKLPHNRKIICFSPHPDDDVISMGGILHKLVGNKNDITVAYMTSGNIAVFDHEVRRYADFMERMARDQHIGEGETPHFARSVNEFLDRKQPGDVDIPEVQDIKRIIREAEAVSGIATLGLGPERARFLNLPFYQTGKVRKDPVSAADVAIVRNLLKEIMPDLIFVAGDLSDPHGTHRMCKEAIDRALGNRESGIGNRESRILSVEDQNQDIVETDSRFPVPDSRHPTAHPLPPTPEVWLYRGAWQEWPVTEATYLVPLSQEELRLKIQAIFKHQSQKDSAPFPGQDDREFWQRVEERNKGTAAQLDRLGLAEYFAMEAYVVE
ncbi:MAG: glucosamine-6-phosphate deaminase [Anaerolineae bacterium]|nr:glucosamine-6-phosphate deaminase [Gemmatimonadaceae bacterium]